MLGQSESIVVIGTFLIQGFDFGGDAGRKCSTTGLLRSFELYECPFPAAPLVRVLIDRPSSEVAAVVIPYGEAPDDAMTAFGECD